MVECVICTCDIGSPAPPHVNSNGVPCKAPFCCECLLKALQYDSTCPSCRVELVHPPTTRSSGSVGPSYNWDTYSDDEDTSGRVYLAHHVPDHSGFTSDDESEVVGRSYNWDSYSDEEDTSGMDWVEEEERRLR